MIPLLCAMLVHVQVLGLLHPHAATVVTAKGKQELRAVGDSLHAGVGPPLPFLHLAAPSPREKPLAVQVAGLTSPRAFAGALQISARSGELIFINEAPLEEYVAAVVAAEMPNAPAAAQEALAVVVRSFAVHAEESPHRASAIAGHGADVSLCDTTHCQLYASGSAAALRSGRAAAQATEDLVLLLPDNRVAPALHHAACGGRTATAREIWPGASDDDELASASVDDRLANGTPACAPGKGEPPLEWRAELDAKALAHALGASLPLSLQIDRAPNDGGKGPGFVRALSANGGKPLGPDELHLALGRALGWNRIRSSRIHWTNARSVSEPHEPIESNEDSASSAGAQVAPEDNAGPDRFVLRGSGFGHGVGLCQRGAARRAKSGETFRRILARYFPKLTVGRLPIHPNPG